MAKLKKLKKSVVAGSEFDADGYARGHVEHHVRTFVTTMKVARKRKKK